MLLQETHRHSKSLSCHLLQKQIEKEYPVALTSRKANNPEFVPYCLERKLGRLITKGQTPAKHKPNDAELLDKITFRNFHKVYQIVSKYENEKYSQLTRKSSQKNLISKDWKVHSLAKLPPRPSSLTRVDLQGKEEKRGELRQKFSKMNEHLFKKMNRVKQPSNHPELQDMYENYIKICEINQNIRREQLLRGSKHRL